MITHLAYRLNTLAPTTPRPVAVDARRDRKTVEKTEKPLWALKLARRARRFKTGA
ncbi:hypothetical protein OVA03_02280 [Asticcacaulis sp. SL142]|uniref:hypothetical protein n=1 Tax=Asticcacaulis sp. SL142 TaxID=2995155 RepID=UPI00226CD389|nr:hypothetical protein [Asticcacaulis sp. SL142]WAC48781.1 hypothetical protein OVA03_02280 [Asticcacaulis sp. SL142]